jgi:hypothetical protein
VCGETICVVLLFVVSRARAVCVYRISEILHRAVQTPLVGVDRVRSGTMCRALPGVPRLGRLLAIDSTREPPEPR